MEVTLSEWITLLISASLGGVVLLTVFSRFRHRWSEQESAARRMTCRLCLHAFEVRHAPKVIECPACGARNLQRAWRKQG